MACKCSLKKKSAEIWLLALLDQADSKDKTRSWGIEYLVLRKKKRKEVREYQIKGFAISSMD